jgi:hypothetical protein
MTFEDFLRKFCENLWKIRRSFPSPSSELKNTYYPNKMDKILPAALVFTNKHGTVFLKTRNLYLVTSLCCRLEFVP